MSITYMILSGCKYENLHSVSEPQNSGPVEDKAALLS